MLREFASLIRSASACGAGVAGVRRGGQRRPRVRGCRRSAPRSSPRWAPGRNPRPGCPDPPLYAALGGPGGPPFLPTAAPAAKAARVLGAGRPVLGPPGPRGAHSRVPAYGRARPLAGQPLPPGCGFAAPARLRFWGAGFPAPAALLGAGPSPRSCFGPAPQRADARCFLDQSANQSVGGCLGIPARVVLLRWTDCPGGLALPLGCARYGGVISLPLIPRCLGSAARLPGSAAAYRRLSAPLPKLFHRSDFSEVNRISEPRNRIFQRVNNPGNCKPHDTKPSGRHQPIPPPNATKHRYFVAFVRAFYWTGLVALPNATKSLLLLRSPI